MNTFDVLKSATSTRPVRAPRAVREPVRKDQVEDASPDRRAERARFAQVLALLAGAGEKTRAEILSRVPAGDASLLDRLLGQAVEAGDEQASLDTAASLRYGMLNDANGRIDALRGAHGFDNSTRGNNLETLARLAERRTTGVEELLALGDNRTADLKAALDALLAHAGTPEAAALSAFGNGDLAAIAHANALVAARAASAADVNTPVADVEALDPELRSRLERVIDRMKAEFGHDVELVETVRSQERQDHLFEQGRTRGGPVVTWTRESAHIGGHAVDVVVDGKWNNPEGYSRLQAIAREEGLRTLGARDPGHLELPKDARTTLGSALADARSTQAAQNARTNATQNDAASGNGIARVASVASVASVARVGENMPSTVAASPASAGASSTGSMVTQQSFTGDGASNHSDKRGESDRDQSRQGDEQSLSPFGIRGPNMATTPGTSASERAAAPAGVESFERAMEAQRVRDSAPARPVSQLTLEVDAPNGSKDEITIGMRGNSVNTRIMTDAQNAERLRMRTGELQDALGKHGLESESVRISGAVKQEAADAAKGVASAADRDALKVGAAQQSQQGDGLTQQHQQRDRTAASREWQERQEARREREEQRRSDDERQRRGPFNPQSK